MKRMNCIVLIRLALGGCLLVQSFGGFHHAGGGFPYTRSNRCRSGGQTTRLFAKRPPRTLKPAAIPLMESGKALARSGELLIDITQDLELYGGALSNAGAQLRNGGDCLAQAGASCRFNTGIELVCDELRETATCLDSCQSKLKAASKDAFDDDMKVLGSCVERSIAPMKQSSVALEAVGECIMMGKTIPEIGNLILEAANGLQEVSAQFKEMAPESKSLLCSQQMGAAAERARDAGYELTGTRPYDAKPKGKAWIKGGK